MVGRVEGEVCGEGGVDVVVLVDCGVGGGGGLCIRCSLFPCYLCSVRPLDGIFCDLSSEGTVFFGGDKKKNHKKKRPPQAGLSQRGLESETKMDTHFPHFVHTLTRAFYDPPTVACIDQLLLFREIGAEELAIRIKVGKKEMERYMSMPVGEGIVKR